jgi:uncharacterized protein YwqG
MFRRLFGLSQKKGPDRPSRDVRQLAQSLPQSAVQAVMTIPRGTSFFGGAPSIVPVSWPSKQGKRLDFLAQIDLAEVQAVLPMDWLPKQGVLLFFYDIKGSAWGFDPKDRGSWAVIHQYVSAGELTPPGSPPPSDPARGRVFVSFRAIQSFPSWERSEVGALNLSEEEGEALIELGEQQFGSQPKHQLGGFPDPIQSDSMEAECQLASNGIYCGDQKHLRDPRVPDLAKGAAEWRLLMQIDSDSSAGFSWGDGGMLYFFVRERDVRAGDFSEVWMVSQCH